MTPVIFVTGISGYIGGHVISRLLEKHPDYAVRALVRDDSQAGAVKSQLPSVIPVIGHLDSHQVIVDESEKADIVLNLASSDHVPFVKSALEGLHKRNKAGVKGYLIHTSGTGVLSEFSPSGPGYATSKIYSDIANIKEITSLPMTALHRDVDHAVIAGGKDADVPTAIVCPPTILGVGKGPSRKRSIQIPWLTEAILKRGKGFTVGPGENWWDLVHIDDLAEAYITLTDEALKIGESNAAWGEEGYSFVEAGEFQWKTVVKSIISHASALGALPNADVDALSAAEASAFHPWAPVLWGSNCRSRADRLRELGWSPKIRDLEPSIAEMVAFEVGSQKTADVKAAV